MSVLVFVLALVPAPALPAFGAEMAEGAEGNIEEYDVRFPPQVVVEEIQARDLDAKAFILVEGALLLPDAITVIDLEKKTRVEIVDERELERYEPVATFRLPEVLDLAPVVREQGEQLVRFEQRMWREGLKLLRREYDGAEGAKVSYEAFRVEFETTGDFYRASVTFYTLKASVRTGLEEVVAKLSAVISGLGEVRTAVDAAGKSVSTEIQNTQAAVAALEKKVKDMKTQLTSLEQSVSSIEQSVH